MTITIVGFTTDDKVPGFFGETKFGQGLISIGALPVKCLLIGNMDEAVGTATQDQDVDQVIDEEDITTLWGARSEIANMGFGALEVPGVSLYGAPVADAAGTASTAVLTVGGAWTVAGEFSLWLGGRLFNIAVGSAETVTDVGDNVVSDTGADAKLFCVGVNAVGVVTFTVNNTGVRGDDHIAFLDKSKIPAGMTLTLVAGTPLTGGLVPFSGGVGADSVTNVLAVLLPGLYDYQAVAQNDATNADEVADQINLKAGPLEGRLEFFACASNGTQSAATAIAQTTLNEQRGQWLWLENSETHPSVIAANNMAFRSVVEPSQPNQNYDDVVLTAVAPQRFEEDRPQHAQKKSALNNSVTPLTTTTGGNVLIVRAITTHSLDGVTPDFRTLDVAEAVVPDRIRKELARLWLDVFRPANPFVGPNPAPEDPLPPEGLATPDIWNSEIEAFLRTQALSPFFWVTDVDNHLPESEFNTDAERIMSAVPVKVTPQNHQVGVSVRQQA